MIWSKNIIKYSNRSWRYRKVVEGGNLTRQDLIRRIFQMMTAVAAVSPCEVLRRFHQILQQPFRVLPNPSSVALTVTSTSWERRDQAEGCRHLDTGVCFESGLKGSYDGSAV